VGGKVSGRNLELVTREGYIEPSPLAPGQDPEERRSVRGRVVDEDGCKMKTIVIQGERNGRLTYRSGAKGRGTPGIRKLTGKRKEYKK